MEGTGRSGVSRRVRIQAALIAIILSIDGIGAYVLGAPAWIAWVYLALALWLAAMRRWFGGKVRVPAPAPAPPPVSEPEPVVAAEPAGRAIGYVCVPSASNGELSRQT